AGLKRLIGTVRGLTVERESLVETACGFKQPGQILPVGSDLWIASTQSFFINSKRTAERRFRARRIAVSFQKQAQIARAAGHFGMLRTQFALPDRQRFFEQRTKRGWIGGKRRLAEQDGRQQKREQGERSHGVCSMRRASTSRAAF